MKYRLCLADADGTLLDFALAERTGIRETLTAFNLPFNEEILQLYIRLNEARWHKLETGENTQKEVVVGRFYDLLAETGFHADAEAMCHFYEKALCRQRQLINGAETFCKAVSSAMPLWIVTNGVPGTQHSRIDPSPISKYLSGLLISEETGHSKPDPAMPLMAMKAAGIAEPSEVVFLGDSLYSDMGAAKNSGAHGMFLWLKEKEPPACAKEFEIVHSLEEAAMKILE